jgi:hypothetical protein
MRREKGSPEKRPGCQVMLALRQEAYLLVSCKIIYNSDSLSV